MKRNDFIKQQVQNLRNEVSENEVMDNVINYAKAEFGEDKHIGFFKFCMQLYADVCINQFFVIDEEEE